MLSIFIMSFKSLMTDIHHLHLLLFGLHLHLKLNGYRVRGRRAVKRYLGLGTTCLYVQYVRVQQRFFECARSPA